MNLAIRWDCPICGASNVTRLGQDQGATPNAVEMVHARVVAQMKANHRMLSARCQR